MEEGQGEGDGSAGAPTEDVGRQPPSVQVHPDSPVNGIYVNFKGLKRVSPNLLIGECAALGGVKTFRDLEWALADAEARLNELELLSGMRADISVSEGHDVDITIIAEERRREITASGNMDRRGEVAADIRVVQPALFGGAMSGMVSAGSGIGQGREYVVRVSTPRFLGRRCTWSFDLARNVTNEAWASSYTDLATSATMRFSNVSGSHSLTLETAVRDLYPTVGARRLPSVEVQSSRLRSVKTSLAHTYAARLGIADLLQAELKHDTELAVPFGDVRFLRFETRAGIIARLPFALGFHAGAAWGTLLPLDGLPTCLQDRFFLGGASGSSYIFKGFQYRGVGPMGSCRLRQQGEVAKNHERMVDSLGGDVMFNAHLALSSPLPLPRSILDADVGARGFLFAGLGSLALMRSSGGLRAVGADVRNGSCGSVGCGVSVPIGGMGSLELTFGHPFWAKSSNTYQRWQLGLRLQSIG